MPGLDKICASLDPEVTRLLETDALVHCGGA
jgi:hypothetical protein